MSSTESSGAPAEATATTPAPEAAFPSFGSTRGSGLSRGKRPTASGPTNANTTPTDYTPTAIAVVSAPREYTNPFAPAEAPAVAAAPEAPPAPVAPAPAPAVAASPAPAAQPAQPAVLNILEPERPRPVEPQTWESDGFKQPAPSSRSEEPAAEIDIASIPPQFLYVREGVTFVPTPKNWGGAPRERKPAPEGESAAQPAESRFEATSVATAPAKSGGFLGWLKSLFGGAPEPVNAGSAGSEHRREGSHRRHRGGRGRSHGGDRPAGEGGDRGHRRHRGGRGRGRHRSEEGSRQGGV
jgi:translation initiation factor IF-2